MKILIIEDNKILAKFMAKGLRKNNFVVEYFLRGDDGENFFFLHHKSFDLIILDLMLPGKSGEDICKNIRKNNIEIPILMLTAKDSIKDKVHGLMIGADDYLVKPFEFEELLARIHALTRRQPHFQKQEINLTKKILFDFQKKAVYKDKKEIKLSPKELSILEVLILNKNKALSRDQIFEKVSDFASDNWSNSIDVHIKNIRKKCFKNDKDPIKTVRGIGYRLETIG